MANQFVRELERISNKLSTQNAANYRRFMEQRYYQTEARLDSVMDATKAFQEEFGIMDLQKQAPVFFENVAQLRLNSVRAELEHARLKAEYGMETPATRAAQEIVRAADRQYQAALAGEEAVMPVAKQNMPEVARTFFDLEKERLILTRILEFLRPMYEQARMEEQRQIQTVQVLDYAVPPVEKAKPRRSVLCITATLSAFLLALIFVLAYSWWSDRHETIAAKLRGASRATRRTSEPVRK